MQTKSEREILIYARFVITATQRRHQPDTTHNTIESIELSRCVRGGKTKRQKRCFEEGYAFVRCACACESQVQFNVIRVTRSESVRVKKRERFEHNTQQ